MEPSSVSSLKALMGWEHLLNNIESKIQRVITLPEISSAGQSRVLTTPRSCVYSLDGPFTSELELMIVVGFFQYRIFCDSGEIFISCSDAIAPCCHWLEANYQINYIFNVTILVLWFFLDTRIQFTTKELAKTTSHNVTIHITIRRARMSSNSHIVSLPKILRTQII